MFCVRTVPQASAICFLPNKSGVQVFLFKGIKHRGFFKIIEYRGLCLYFLYTFFLSTKQL